MIVGVCGFSSSGSSAIVDYLKEFDTTSTIDDIEFVLPYYPDGLEDLDFHLNYCVSKYMSSAVAIERFNRHIYNYFLRRHSTSQQKQATLALTTDYINSITQIKWNGHGGIDCQLNCPANYKSKLAFLPRRIIVKLCTQLEKTFGISFDQALNHEMFFSIQPDEFLAKTKEFVKNLLLIYGADFSKTVIINQPFSGNDPQKSFKFFDNPKAIVVDRDPRDVYLFAKLFLKSKGRQIPTDSVENFICYYKNMRENQPYKNEDERILLLNFEELVYDYEKTSQKIDNFCMLNHEDKGKTLFAPEMSKQNTQLFARFPNYACDIQKIEQSLAPYLFPFEKYESFIPKGKMFYGRSPLNK